MSTPLSQSELLQYAIANDMIDLDTIQKQVEMNERRKYLKEHPFSIWEDKKGTWHTYLPDEEKGRVPRKRNTRKEIENVIVDYWKEQEQNPTVKEVFHDWLNDKVEFNEISKATYDRYVVDFNKYFTKLEKRKIRTIEEDELEYFVKSSIAEYNMTSKCFSNFRTLIYGIFKRAKKKKFVSFSITEVMKDMEISNKSFKKVVKRAEDQVYSSSEKSSMETYLEENPDITNLGLLLMFKTGLRVGELSTIKTGEIENYTIPINRTETRYKDENGKVHYEVKEFPKSEAGLRLAIVPTQYKWIIDKILELNPNGEYLFMKKGKRIKTYSFRKRLRYICEEKININPKSPHKVRKTYGTILMDGNVRESTLLETMGHADILVTKNHYYFDRTGIEDKRKELEKVAEL